MEADKFKLARYLCESNQLTDEDKKEVMQIAEKYCNGDPHNDSSVLWGYIKKISDACD